MKTARSGWIVSLAILLFFVFLRLMTQGSSQPKPSAAPEEAPPIEPVPAEEQITVIEPQQAARTSESKPTRGHRRFTMPRLTALVVSLAMVPSLVLAGAGTAFAASSVDSPGKVDPDTIRLNWTGQGTTSGQIDQSKCGDSADPGSGGFQNGATADDYILWIFNTDGGGIVGDFTITVNGTTYGNSNGNNQIVTPSYDPASITDAHTNFVVDTTGNGSWVLTISHGCIKTVEDIPFAPTGHLGGPCADPAYYAVFDNSATDPSITVKYRMRWYNTSGLNTAVKQVPGGMIWTTWQHWAKPGTYVSVWYKDPTTLAWVLLERQLVAPGNHPPCQYTPGWSTPV